MEARTVAVGIPASTYTEQAILARGETVECV